MLEVRGPNIRVPPAFYVGWFLVGLWVESVKRLRFVDNGESTRLLGTIGWAIALLGLLVSVSGIATFRLAGTTMFPFEPASRLVERGPYRFTRNPMYLGGAISYVGIALAMNTMWPILLLPFVIWTVARFVIREEEQYLLATFGEEYAAYQRRVRRWL